MLYTKTWGSKDNPALIFLHGFLGSHTDFNKIYEKLSKSYYCVGVDLPFHGKSNQICPNNYAKFDQIMIDTLKPYTTKTTFLIGYSLGGRVAQRIYSKLKLNGLILISSAIENLNLSQAIERKQLTQKHIESLLKLPFDDFLKQWYQNPLFKTLLKKPKLLQHILSQRQNNNPKLMAKALSFFSPDLFKLNTKVACNINHHLLYIFGHDDQKYREIANNLSAKNSKAWLNITLGASHSTHLEYPCSITSIINQFIGAYHDNMARDK